MAIPSGRRNSDPVPLPNASGTRAEQRGEGGHHDRTEAQQAGLIDRVDRRLPSLRSASSAKSIIMMAFFFTIPISRMMPIKAITLEIEVKQNQREDGAHTGRRQRRQNRDGVNVALIQHPEHDVHGHNGGQNQPALVVERAWKARAVPWNASLNAGGRLISAAACWIAFTASPREALPPG